MHQDSTFITPVQQMISSCTGAMITSIFVTPLDVIKIRLQAQQKQFMKNKCFLYCNGLMEHLCYCTIGNGHGNASAVCLLHGNTNFKNAHSYHSISVTNLTDKSVKNVWYQRPTYFNGTWDAFLKITRNEGITSLWSGLPPTLVMAVPATVMYFTIYDQLCARLRAKYPSDSLWIPVCSGASARSFSVTLISPIEMIRTKMQSKRLSYLEIGTAVKHSVKTEGILSLWRGLGPTLLRDVPFSALYWFNYEGLKKYFDQRNPTFSFSLFAGAISGSIAAVITLPFDVVKTHRQIELGESSVTGAQVSKRTADVMRQIVKERGARGLFTGIVPRLSKVAPACALMISTYESGKSFFRGLNEAKLQERKINQL